MSASTLSLWTRTRRGLTRGLAAAVALVLWAAPSTAQTGDALRPTIQPFQTPLPIADASAQELLDERPGEPIHCTVTALVDEYGAVRDAFPLGCPRALRDSAIGAVRSWQFHPPVVGGRAVAGRTTVEFIFVSHSVVVKSAVPSGAYLVRLGPTAYPLWPSPPELPRSAQRELDSAAGISCQVAFEVDDLGLPQKLLVEDCPSSVRDRVLRRAYRFGFRVEGARPGDGTVYHMDLWLGLPR